MMASSTHLDYVDCRTMLVMNLLVVAVEIQMKVDEDLIDHLLDHRRRLVSMMKH